VAAASSDAAADAALPRPLDPRDHLQASGKLQERAYGGLSKATAHKLEQAGADPLSCGAAKGREHARRPQRGLDRDAGDVPGGRRDSFLFLV
jgi:hypothetical protein